MRCCLAAVLRRRNLSWSDLARRTRYERAVIRRLRHPRANPTLALAYDVAAALGVGVEELWRLHE